MPPSDDPQMRLIARFKSCRHNLYLPYNNESKNHIEQHCKEDKDFKNSPDGDI